jgi:acyl-CoA synthetase (AMP-forming)/AMP-acid ligase II
MDKIFLIDKNTITYKQVIDYLNGDLEINNGSYFENKILFFLKSINSNRINSFENLRSNIINYEGLVTIETSGTSGNPKKVFHTIQNLIKNVKILDKYTENIWVNTYDPSKMAFYQVFFQSILNYNTLVNCFGENFKTISNKINFNYCTHISATPTFYKMLSSDLLVYNNIKQVTIGGEPVQDSLFKMISLIFPNAKVKNIYASTEASSLLSSNSNIFTIPESLKNQVKIENNELLLNKNLLGNFDCEDWFNTGDLIEMVSENSFKINGRKNFLTKVAGYLLNPIQIEEEINKFPFVKICKIYSKNNSVTGNILTCDIVLNEKIEISEIKKQLSNKLKKHEIPSIFRVVENIVFTETNKIKR